MRIAKTIFSVALIGSMLFVTCGNASAMSDVRLNVREELEGNWDNEFVGENPDVKFYPDAYANYWRFALNRTDEYQNVGIKVTGSYPDARYMSFNVYNDKNLSPIASITDVDITPDAGSVNPFVTESNADNSYTIYVVPEGTNNVSGDNVVYFDDSLNRISVFLRYYLPEQNTKGGVTLPTIEAFDLTTGETVELPKKYSKFVDSPSDMRLTVGNYLMKGIINPLFLLNRNGELSAYHSSGNGMFPNKDNDYLVMPINKQDDEVAVVRFKAPELSTKTNEGDVRYYSVGQGDDQSHNLLTLSDEDLKVASDGYVYVVISEEEVDVNTELEYNYMP